MAELLVKLYLIAALMQLWISYKDVGSLSEPNGLKKIDQASHEITKIPWKPFSIFPEEAKRFK